MTHVRHYICNTCLQPTVVQIIEGQKTDFNCNHCHCPVKYSFDFRCTKCDQWTYCRYSPENVPDVMPCEFCSAPAIRVEVRSHIKPIQTADSREVDRYIDDCESGIPEGREQRRRNIERLKNPDPLDECINDAIRAGDIGIERLPPKAITPQ